MAHRSNQAVASQERELTQPPDDPPPPRRLIAGWSMALGALGISLILLAAGLWFVRFSIASFMLGAALSERGADADFQFINLDLNSAALANVRFGSSDDPDATIPLVEARWRWEGLTPRLYFLRVVRPRLHLRMDEAGRVSAGSLEHPSAFSQRGARGGHVVDEAQSGACYASVPGDLEHAADVLHPVRMGELDLAALLPSNGQHGEDRQPEAMAHVAGEQTDGIEPVLPALGQAGRHRHQGIERRAPRSTSSGVGQHHSERAIEPLFASELVPADHLADRPVVRSDAGETVDRGPATAAVLAARLVDEVG